MSVLDRIVENTRGVIAEARRVRPEPELRDALSHVAPVRDFVASLRVAAQRNIAVIAEVKKASPSAGLIRADFDPVAIARAYEANGAACLSVLTDEKHFQGHLDYLRAVRAAVSIPVLRKDFIVDRYQVLEARAAGADCILLIAECLNDCEMRDLYFYASELGMECLIELYEPENLDRVLKLDPPLVGINNRNLKTMITELDHSLRLRKQIPESVLLVSESGIKTRTDVERLLEHNVRAILVGESLMKQPDVGVALSTLLGKT
jgi:indole-3-glycerol phosphate synthase